MPKPPPATPHSDIDGVHQDEELNAKVAAKLGQSAGSLEHAKDEAVARPEHLDKEGEQDGATG